MIIINNLDKTEQNKQIETLAHLICFSSLTAKHSLLL